MTTTAAYPEKPGDRTRWIRERRHRLKPGESAEPPGVLIEQERLETGEIATTGTIFLVHRECPWTCAMCDLWRNTTPVSTGSVAAQFEYGIKQIRDATILKLYNSGSFFDSGAISKAERERIAVSCKRFNRVIVESHPRLIGADVLQLCALIHPAALEVAMGLETCHPRALERLNKRFTPEEFGAVARFLRSNDVSVRTFLLVGVPFIAAAEQRRWLEASIEFAFTRGSNVVSLIPTRKGNGTLEALEEFGEFASPTLTELERAQEFGIHLRRGRVFADTWEAERFATCAECAPARLERLHRMNLSQRIEPAVPCACAA